MPLHFKAHSAIKITQGDNGRQVRNGPCSLCYSRAASVLVPAPTQHSVTWPIHGHVSQFSNRAPRLPAWRALRRAAVPLAASRHRRCTRVAHTWRRCCCTAARDGVASLVQRCSAPAWQHGALRFSPPSHPSFRPFPFFLLFCFVFFVAFVFCHRDFSFLFFRLACLVTWSFVVFVLLWGSLSMGMTLTVIPSGSRTCQFHGRIPRNVCRGQRYRGGYALWPFGYSVGLLLPSSHLPHHSVDSPALYYLFYSLPSPRTSGPVGRVQAQRSG